MARLDWTKPVASLVYSLQQEGLRLASVYDGEEKVTLAGLSAVKARKEAVEVITSVDIATLTLRDANNSGCAVNIILGNEPEELAADWYGQNSVVVGLLDKGIEAYINRWQGKKCPKVAN